MSAKVDEVCDHIIQTGLHADMSSNLSWDTLTAETLNEPKSGTKRDFVEAHLATIHNVLRKNDSARAALRQLQAFDVLQKFRSCTEFPVSLSYIALITWTTNIVYTKKHIFKIKTLINKQRSIFECAPCPVQTCFILFLIFQPSNLSTVGAKAIKLISMQINK